MSSAAKPYRVIVIGGGHAGVEAAWAAANMLAHEADDPAAAPKVALITMDPAKIGVMSCNPAIGGLAKGQMVREIDAMGGVMALAADATGIQFRVLNASKGAAVRGPRCQSDKYRYAQEVQRLLATRPNLDILAGTVDDFVVEAGRCQGVVYRRREGEQVMRLHADAVVLTTGTFMRGLMHTGPTKTAGGRVGEQAATGVSAALGELGFELGRLKTGTPPRLAAPSLDLASLEKQDGDQQPTPFSDMTGTGAFHDFNSEDNHSQALTEVYQSVVQPFPVLEQRCCWLTQTNPAIHDLIRANLDRAPMYNGQIHDSAGPRYCPSIEDKVVRFADRTAHHLFLEPESLDTDEIYCNGVSTSLPTDVQDQMIHALPGCERAEILRYGYAVEYDMVWPHQIDATAMTKRIEGLFLAGQINGTSGYEEAAGQGLLAGVNAVRFSRGETLVRLLRDQAYLGVLMDDLVTKTPREPYRMFTSRAEHRLVLRADNAAQRLTPMARELGLIDDWRWSLYRKGAVASEALLHYLNSAKKDGKCLSEWIRRPEVDRAWVLTHLNGDGGLPVEARQAPLIDRVLADAQYAGYINRHQRQHERLIEQEARSLPANLDYARVEGLSREASDTLNHFRPATLGQAGRLSGVTPADLMIVSVSMGW